MDKYQHKIHNQANTLLKLHKDFDDLKKDAFYQKVIQKVKEHVLKIEMLLMIQFPNKAHAKIKERNRQELELICLRISNLLKSYACFNKYSPFLDLKGFGKNQLYKYSGLNLLNKSKDLQVFIKKYNKKAKEAQVDTLLFENLNSAITDFKKHLNQPQKSNESIKNASQEIRNQLKAYKFLIKNVLKGYMFSKYQQEKPLVYKKFIQCIEMSKVPKRKRALVGKITDTKGNPIHRVRVSVDGKKPLVKRGTKGNYFFKNMPNGSHKIKFSCNEFKSVLRVVMIHPSRTTWLNVVMQREKAVELNEPIASLRS
jgi:hypothetical protein